MMNQRLVEIPGSILLAIGFVSSTILDDWHISLKVPIVEFNFIVSVRHCLLSTHTSQSNSTLGTHLHAKIRIHHFDFDFIFDLSAHLCQKPYIEVEFNIRYFQ